MMAKQIAAKCRNSASLLLLAHRKPAKGEKFDYDALLFERTAKSTFMPHSMVFPGGVCEAMDSAHDWLAHFQSFGIDSTQLQRLANVRGARPDMFTTNATDALASAIALRITAIRETFEEVGVMLCRERQSLKSDNQFAHFKEDFDRAHWQRLVHNDAQQFLKLCQTLDVVPDIWNLHEWSVWRTPVTFQKRFETAFFLAPLRTKPQLLPEPQEVANHAWRTPLDYLQAGLRKELWLPPPQFYELSRCLHYTQLTQLQQFAKQRADKGMTLMLPVQYKCTDGSVHLLPGDDLYPTVANDSCERIETGLSTAEFRARAQRLHRTEFQSQHTSKLLLNFDSADGQLRPLDPSNALPA